MDGLSLLASNNTHSHVDSEIIEILSQVAAVVTPEGHCVCSSLGAVVLS
jgi:hypothetical protein